jgi:hypothetical protein
VWGCFTDRTEHSRMPRRWRPSIYRCPSDPCIKGLYHKVVSLVSTTSTRHGLRLRDEHSCPPRHAWTSVRIVSADQAGAITGQSVILSIVAYLIRLVISKLCNRLDSTSTRSTLHLAYRTTAKYSRPLSFRETLLPISHPEY